MTILRLDALLSGVAPCGGWGIGVGVRRDVRGGHHWPWASGGSIVRLLSGCARCEDLRFAPLVLSWVSTLGPEGNAVLESQWPRVK